MLNYPRYPRPILGKDLELLRFDLGLSVHDAQWQLGLSPNKWGEYKNTLAKYPLPNLSLALLARHLLEDHSLVEIEKPPTARQVMAAINDIRPNTTEKRMSLMFGRAEGAATLWLEGGNSTPTMDRLFTCFMKMIRRGNDNGERLNFLDNWEKIVEYEARQRGIPNIFDSISWTQSTKLTGHPVLGEDLLNLKQDLGIKEANDACWMLGLRIGSWGLLTRQNPRQPVNDAALAILVRVLQQDHSLSPLRNPDPPLDLFNEVKSYGINIGKKKFAEIFGNEGSSGYKWVKAGGRPGPAIRKLMLAFRKSLDSAKKDEFSGVSALVERWDVVLKRERLSIANYLTEHPEYEDSNKFEDGKK